jgi:outer membrane immunogenic protein
MNKFLVSAASLVLVATTSSAALAADPVFFEPTPSPIMAPVSLYDWTGFYAGVNAGFGGGTFRHPISVTGTEILSANVTSSGFLLGGQVGYNMQFDSFVAGVEADLQWANVRGQLDLSVPAAIFPPGGDLAFGTEVNWFGTVRARLGYTPVDRMLIYGTGGFAYGGMRSYVRGTGGFAGIDESATSSRWGWTIGGGAEYAFTDALSLKSEYLYTDLGRSNIATFDLGGGNALSFDRRVSFHTVRAGLNFHF